MKAVAQSRPSLTPDRTLAIDLYFAAMRSSSWGAAAEAFDR
jgi:hypothetical protein